MPKGCDVCGGAQFSVETVCAKCPIRSATHVIKHILHLHTSYDLQILPPDDLSSLDQRLYVLPNFCMSFQLGNEVPVKVFVAMKKVSLFQFSNHSASVIHTLNIEVKCIVKFNTDCGGSRRRKKSRFITALFVILKYPFGKHCHREVRARVAHCRLC